MTSNQKVRAICFYLPQFHPVPENNEWWGKGFTEWTNVVKATPQFPGHYQPHLPADLGFCDLRVPETREAQAVLAQEHGIFGFCYYHYWFNGRRILERPINEVLATGRPDFPFCLCWANENWSRRWDGLDHEILLRQVYSPEDDLAHLSALAPYFRDRRYIRVGGKPLFLVYRASNLPDAAGTVTRWRAKAAELGFPGIYLCNVESLPRDKNLTLAAGFDAAVEYAPDWEYLPPPIRPFFQLPMRVQKRINRMTVWSRNNVVEYVELRDRMLAKPHAPYLRFPGVTPSWDNSARRYQNAFIARNSTPSGYEIWLKAAIARFRPPGPEENFIFINAWNEWAEGNHLEPCSRWGRAYLDATKRSLAENSGSASPTSLLGIQPKRLGR
jgi:lipopolysaccharide biosynthesis protein